MFSFFKKGNKNEGVPEWASFFSKSEYNKFLSVLDRYLKKKGITYTLGNGMINISENAFGFGQMGLINVAQVCKNAPGSDWNDLVAGHFEAMIKGKEFDTEFNKRVDEFEFAKSFLGVRIYHSEYIDALGRSMVLGKELAKGIFAMIVFDLPNTITNVQPSQLKVWNKTEDELFQIGVENIYENNPVEISEQEVGKIKLFMAQGGHFFAPNVVFNFDKYPELMANEGALVGIPHRHVALIYPIRSTEVVLAINEMIPLINYMFGEGPGSISDKLYWLKDGHFEDLPYNIEDNKLKFFPPESLVELLNRLAK